jgi:hypothetical protein
MLVLMTAAPLPAQVAAFCCWWPQCARWRGRCCGRCGPAGECRGSAAFTRDRLKGRMSAREDRSAEGTPAGRAGHVGKGCPSNPKPIGPLDPRFQCPDITESNKATPSTPRRALRQEWTSVRVLRHRCARRWVGPVPVGVPRLPTKMAAVLAGCRPGKPSADGWAGGRWAVRQAHAAAR